MTKLPKQKILVDLDCLLDTRIGTVAMISEELATEVLKKNYLKRVEDKFEGVDPEQYKQLYDNRNEDTLKMSTITTFLPVLRHLCHLILEEAVARPFHSGPEVVVNVFPYFMTDEVADAIKAAVMRWVGIMTPVSVCRIDPKEMSPSFCQDFTLLVMYDPTVWFNENLEQLLKKPIRDVALYTPLLLRNRVESDEELKKLVDEYMEPFAALELVMKTVVDVQFLDSYYFSIFDPKAIIDYSAFQFSSDPGPVAPQTAS